MIRHNRRQPNRQQTPKWAGSSLPVPVYTFGALAGKTLTQIAAGDSTCALDTTGRAYCWGGNQWGELGNGSTTTSNEPVAVDTGGALAGKTLTAIGVGEGWACALDTAGKAYCWGGQQGTTYLPDTLSPVAVDTTGVLAGKVLVRLSVQDNTACAIDQQGAAYCWGYGLDGELGDGQTTSSAVPVAVDRSGALDGVKLASITVGFHDVCGVDTTGGGIAGVRATWGNLVTDPWSARLHRSP